MTQLAYSNVVTAMNAKISSLISKSRQIVKIFDGKIIIWDLFTILEVLTNMRDLFGKIILWDLFPILEVLTNVRDLFTFLEVLLTMWNMSLSLQVPNIFDTAQ